MATKPAATPQWDSTETNLVEPTTEKTSGWAQGPGSAVNSSYFNWFMWTVWKWLEYLEDGDLEGDVTLDGTLEIGGDTFAHSNLTVEGDLYGFGGAPVNMPDSAVMPELYLTTARTKHVSNVSAYDESNTHTRSASQIILAASANKVFYPIELDVGDHITRFRVRLAKNTTNSDEISVDLVSIDEAGADTLETGTNASSGPVVVTLDSGAIDVEVESGKAYALRVEPSGAVAPAADRLYWASYSWTRPVP